jgi:hypothetical protein
MQNAVENMNLTSEQFKQKVRIVKISKTGRIAGEGGQELGQT